MLRASLLLVFTSASSVLGNSMYMHLEVLRRCQLMFSGIAPSSNISVTAASLFDDVLHNQVNYIQQGAVFPDWLYTDDSLHGAGEAAHWPRWLAVAVEDIRKTYGTDVEQWKANNEAKGRIAFLLGVVTHYTPDATYVGAWKPFSQRRGFEQQLQLFNRGAHGYEGVGGDHMPIELLSDFYASAMLSSQRSGSARHIWNPNSIDFKWLIDVFHRTAEIGNAGGFKGNPFSPQDLEQVRRAHPQMIFADLRPKASDSASSISLSTPPPTTLHLLAHLALLGPSRPDEQGRLQVARHVAGQDVRARPSPRCRQRHGRLCLSQVMARLVASEARRQQSINARRRRALPLHPGACFRRPCIRC